MDEIELPKTAINPNLIKLQSEATEYITSIILLHEKRFYEIVQNNFPDKKSDILGTTCKTIIDMISEATNTYFNQIYLDCQNKKYTVDVSLVIRMASYGEYGPHILLDKLIRLVLDIHCDVIREELCVDNLEKYTDTILKQINSNLKKMTLIYELEKSSDDTNEFWHVPANKQPFSVSLDIIYDSDSDN